MKNLIRILMTVTLWMACSPAAYSAEPGFQVVVNPANPITTVDQKFLTDIFLKKKTYWSDMKPILVVDLLSISGVRKQFSEKVLNRPVSAVRNYWQQMLFSGRGVPPPELRTDREVLTFISENEEGIGYVSPHTDIGNLKSVKIIK